jgi:hypothetical protein
MLNPGPSAAAASRDAGPKPAIVSEGLNKPGMPRRRAALVVLILGAATSFANAGSSAVLQVQAQPSETAGAEDCLNYADPRFNPARTDAQRVISGCEAKLHFEPQSADIQAALARAYFSNKDYDHARQVAENAAAQLPPFTMLMLSTFCARRGRSSRRSETRSSRTWRLAWLVEMPLCSIRACAAGARLPASQGRLSFPRQRAKDKPAVLQ